MLFYSSLGDEYCKVVSNIESNKFAGNLLTNLLASVYELVNTLVSYRKTTPGLVKDCYGYANSRGTEIPSKSDHYEKR